MATMLYNIERKIDRQWINVVTGITRKEVSGWLLAQQSVIGINIVDRNGNSHSAQNWLTSLNSR